VRTPLRTLSLCFYVNSMLDSVSMSQSGTKQVLERAELATFKGSGSYIIRSTSKTTFAASAATVRAHDATRQAPCAMLSGTCLIP